uniref:Uncharacterized protein n=1 Tax=Alpinia oxyphylla TaxID=125261 RepID=A0A286MFP5_9LILI|nr:hypothetical protein [Alpinia oxyphylla]ASW20457.1 hypothetical protein [Alpinia oxyphylla]
MFRKYDGKKKSIDRISLVPIENSILIISLLFSRGYNPFWNECLILITFFLFFIGLSPVIGCLIAHNIIFRMKRRKRCPKIHRKIELLLFFFDFHSFFFRSNSIQRRTTFIILLDSIFCLSISGSSILLIRSRKTFILDLIQQHHEYRLLSPGFLSFISFIKYYILFYIT